MPKCMDPCFCVHLQCYLNRNKRENCIESPQKLLVSFKNENWQNGSFPFVLFNVYDSIPLQISGSYKRKLTKCRACKHSVSELAFSLIHMNKYYHFCNHTSSMFVEEKKIIRFKIHAVKTLFLWSKIMQKRLMEFVWVFV